MVSTVRNFWASDLGLQRRQRISAPAQVRVGDYTGPLLEQLELPVQDRQGNSLTYHWCNHTRGTLLAESEPIGEAVQEEDHVMLMGELTAGRC